MSLAGAILPYIDIVLVFGVLLAIAPYFGEYLARVYQNRPAFGDSVLLPVERFLYRLLGTDPRHSMRAREFLFALLLTNAVVLIWIFLLQSYQQYLPLNPLGIPGMTPDLAFHTAASFTTNTDFTHYTAETQSSLVADQFGLLIAMFISPATGLAALAALVRGFVRKDGTVGNFYVDLVRSLTRVLLPIAFLGAIVLVLLGVPETFATTITYHPILGGSAQVVPIGPVASWESIMMLGSNGGGFYSANANMPFENPSAASNLFQVALMLLFPLSAPFAFAGVVRKKGEGWPYLGTILIILVIALGLFIYSQGSGNPNLATVPHLSGVDGFYWVGQDTRFSPTEAALFQVVSVYDNVGANNLAIGSITPLAQMDLLFGMFTQSTPGGVGTGFGTLLVYGILAVFVSGLMVGRTPEYLGKKIGTSQVRWSTLVLLLHPALIFLPLAATILGGFVPLPGSPVGAQAHAFTTVLYEFTSESANNGSAMAYPGYNDNTVWMNVVGGLVMLFGRFLPIVAMVVVGGMFAKQDVIPPGPGTLQTRSLTFTLFLTLFLIIISALLFLPVLALGPLAQLGI